MKTLVRVFSFFILVMICGYGYLFYKNNRAESVPESASVRHSFEVGVEWLLKNKSDILKDRNAMLWWMIDQSFKNTNDEHLEALLAEYKATQSHEELQSVWKVFLNPEKYWGENFPYASYAPYYAYQKYFLFSITCGKELADDPIITEQNNVNFCDKKITDPACATHQLMAYRLMQRYGCDRLNDLPQRVGALQNKITGKLTTDPRVVDVYIQRVLMLIDSGAANRVKPVWLNQILKAQLADGSWPGKQPLFRIGERSYVSFGDLLYLPYFGEVAGTFHATAQGIWLMSMLQDEAVLKALAKSTVGFAPRQ